MGRVVLVTGVSGYLGGKLASHLVRDPDVSRVIGVDVVPPSRELDRIEFVRTDLRTTGIAKVIRRSGADTVAHLNMIMNPVRAGGRVPMKELNVLGSMQLLAACQRAGSVRRLVFRSGAVFYGCGPRSPALFSEDTEPVPSPASGWGRDLVEVERYLRDFSRRRPDVEVASLRMAHVIGPEIRTSLTDYFCLPVLPTPAGFDARLQFLHEHDALRALHSAALSHCVGAINLAGDGVLMLSQAARLAGRPVAPLPRIAAPLLRRLVPRGLDIDLSADQLRLLSFGSVLDTTRMRRDMRFEPLFSTREAFEDFVRGRHLPGARRLDRSTDPHRSEQPSRTPVTTCGEPE
ncbi:MAG: UDP-glucose 4-epimerase [Actinomycetota bacterium]|nr:UDP-glucose 4-epimerase [Actinomycetota bacterium]